MENILTRTNVIETYLSSIRDFKMMSPDEEVVAFERYHAGDVSMKEKIINANLRFVFSKAKQFCKDPYKVLDYNNEGVMGMMEAVDNFDEKRGVKFFTYAVHYIVRNMVNYRHMSSSEVAQTNYARIGILVPKIISEFFAKEYRDPTEDEIIEILEGRGVKVIDKRDVVIMHVKSINDIYGDSDDECTLEESSDFALKTASDNEYLAKMNRDHVKSRMDTALNFVTKKEKEVMTMLLGLDGNDPMQEWEIADRLDLTVTRIQQLRASAVRKLSKLFAQAA